jgi:hypothetical protein
LTLPADIAKTLALCDDLYKYVNSWGCDIWTICSINFNLHRSCKLGLHRMCFLCEFIVGMWLLVAKHGDCLKKLTRTRFFWLLAWNITYVFNKLLRSFFVLPSSRRRQSYYNWFKLFEDFEDRAPYPNHLCTWLRLRQWCCRE